VNRWELRGQLRAQTALSPGKEAPAYIEQEAGLTKEPFFFLDVAAKSKITVYSGY
jgi:hypothetical protein